MMVWWHGGQPILRNALFLFVICICIVTLFFADHRSLQRKHARLSDDTRLMAEQLAVTYAPVFQTQVEAAQREPELIRRLHELHDAIDVENTCVWTPLFEAGTLYKRGQYPFIQPDARVAEEIFRAIALWCPDAALAREARSKLFEDPISVADSNHEAPRPPAYIGHAMIAHALRHKKQRQAPPISPNIKPSPPPPPAPPTIFSDAQNVHDHGVTRSIKKTLEALPGMTHDPDAIRCEVESCILDDTLDVTDQQRAEALACLGSLRDDTEHSALGISEVESLGRVWQCLESAPSKEMLVKQLASGMECGLPVCSTGKIARIVGTLDGIEAPVSLSPIRPLWAIQDELTTLAASVRTDVLRTASAQHREEYETGGYETVLESTMKEQFDRRALEEYVETLGMSRDVLAPIIETVKAGF